MKHLLICISVLATVSVASASSFSTTVSSKRKPAQTGNVGPAEAKPEFPATVECSFNLNGNGGEKQSFPITIKGSEATENLDANAKPVLGGGSNISADVSIRQVYGTTYAAVIWVTDDLSGVQTLKQDFLEFPAVMQVQGFSAMLLFKTSRTITLNGKKVELKMVQVGCSLVRKQTI